MDSSSANNDYGYPASEPIPDIQDYHHELTEFLLDNREMHKAARHGLAQGLWAGGGAVAGGLLLGPVGGLIGGVAGSVVGFFRSENYNGVVQQVLELDEDRQRRLVRGVQQVLATAGAANLATPSGFRAGLVEFASRAAVRDKVWHAIEDAIRQ